MIKTKVTELLKSINMEAHAAEIAFQILLIAFIIILCLTAQVIIKKILLQIQKHLARQDGQPIHKIVAEGTLFTRIGYLATPLIINVFKSYFYPYEPLLDKLVSIYTIITIILILNSFFKLVESLYKTHEISKSRPIKGFLQAVEVCIMIIGTILVISVLINKNPVILLSGLGAMAAILTLVFKDSLLGLVAGFQISLNDMVRIGDWIEVPQSSVDGTVKEITLTIVKVENFDNTISTIPAYTLFSSSFKNWRGMEVSGNRRIARSIQIDAGTVQFASERVIRKFRYIKDVDLYLQTFGEKNAAGGPTNIGIFRVYMEHYLKEHVNINNNLTHMVRQLAYGGFGIPLEIYAFVNDTKWVNYEKIQTNIFEHFLAIAPEFELRIYQNPTGNDFRQIAGPQRPSAGSGKKPK